MIEVSQKKLELEQLKGLISYFEGGETLYQTQELTREYYQNLLDKIKNREGFYADNSVEYDLTGLEKVSGRSSSSCAGADTIAGNWTD